MAFDPDKFLKKYETQASPKEEKPRRKAFDPDEFLREKKSVVESAARGAAQGASFGFADEITGALEAVKDVALTDKELGDLVDQYKKRRDESRKEYDMAEKDNSGAYMAGNVAGGVATAFIPGVGLAGNLGKGASLGAKVAQGAKLGAVEGAAFGLGESRADLTEGDVGGVLKDTATGAAVGGALGGALPAVGHGLGKVLNSNPARTATKKTANLAVDLPEQYTDMILDNPKLIRDPATLPTVQDEVVKAANNLSEIVKELDNAAWNTLDDTPLVKSTHLDAIVQNEMVNKGIMRADKSGNVSFSSMGKDKIALRKAQEIMDELKSFDILSQKDMKNLIQKIDNEINWEKEELDQANHLLMGIRHQIDEALKKGNPRYKEAMKHVSDQTDLLDRVKKEFRLKRDGSGGLRGTDTTLSKLKTVTDALGDPKRPDAYGVLQDLSDFRKDSLARGTPKDPGIDGLVEKMDFTKDLQVSKMMSSTEGGVTNGSKAVNLGTIILGGLGLIGGPTGGIGGALLGAGLGVARDKYGRNLGRKAIHASAGAINNIDAFAAKLGNLPPKYIRALESAARRGGESAAITHMFLLENDPEYKKAMGED